MDEKLPKVSIVLPTYNGLKYIRQSINSCLNQTYKNIELIVVDDGSTDKTSNIIKSYGDKRIKYLKHKNNKGIPYALNTGFTNSTGEYLTWTSDDNLYAKDAIERMLSFLKAKKCPFVYCDFYLFKNDNTSEKKLVELKDVISLRNHNDIGPCFLYSSRVKEVIGDYDTNVTLAEDYDYWIRVSKKFSMCHLAKPLYFYRMHTKSLSLSRFYEVRIVDILVRLKNELLDIDSAVDYLVSWIARRYPGNFRINRVIAKIIFSRKIRKELRDFRKGNLDFNKAKLALRNIMVGD